MNRYYGTDMVTRSTGLKVVMIRNIPVKESHLELNELDELYGIQKVKCMHLFL